MLETSSGERFYTVLNKIETLLGKGAIHRRLAMQNTCLIMKFAQYCQSSMVNSEVRNLINYLPKANMLFTILIGP